jgi:hypothetical protein
MYYIIRSIYNDQTGSLEKILISNRELSNKRLGYYKYS